MSRCRCLAVLLVALAVGACNGGEDEEVRTWIRTQLSPYLQAQHEWNLNTVHPALRAYCELEQKVYDVHHLNGPIPVNRYCPPDDAPDPVLPPQPPEELD